MLVRGLCGAYVETVRNVPLLVQLLMLYFALTQLLPDSTEPIELVPGVWLSKGGLSMPWPVRGGGRPVAQPFRMAGARQLQRQRRRGAEPRIPGGA